jgi:hypothetical protein
LSVTYKSKQPAIEKYELRNSSNGQWGIIIWFFRIRS